MPKKKLTKAQVKAEYKKLIKGTNRLFNDKMSYPDSKVTMSLKMLLQMAKDVLSAFNRVK